MIQNVNDGVGQFTIVGEHAGARVNVVEIDAALMTIDDNRRAAEQAFVNRFVGAFALRQQQRNTRIRDHARDFLMRNVFENCAVILEVVSP